MDINQHLYSTENTLEHYITAMSSNGEQFGSTGQEDDVQGTVMDLLYY